MEPCDSQAAVDAMRALQDRVRELERSNATARKECERMRALLESDVRDREGALTSAAAEAQEMLDGAAGTLAALRAVRRENRGLEDRAAALARQLADARRAAASERGRLSKLSRLRANAERLIAGYEALLCELLAPPNFGLPARAGLPFNRTAHSLPATLQACVQALQALPAPFRDQKLDRKREVIATLLDARNIAYRMAEEIHRLELQLYGGGSQRRIQAEIDVKSVHLEVVTQAMSRFKFG